MSLEDSARMALAAGAICVEGENTINEALCERELFDRAGLAYPEDMDDADWTME